MSLASRNIGARATSDIDFEVRSDEIEIVEQRLIQCSSIDLNDFHHFEFVESSRLTNMYEEQFLVQYKFQSSFGGTNTFIKVDLALVDDEGFDVQFISPDGLGVLQDPNHKYAVVSLERQLAQKIAATLQVYVSGPSSRIRDLFDIVWISKNYSLDERSLRKQLIIEFRRRGLEEFSKVPPDGWQDLWQKNLSSAPISVRRVSYDKAVLLFNKLLSTAETSTSRTWDPGLEDWIL